MLSCKKVSHLNSARFDRSLSLSEKIQVWIHLRICKACRTAFTQFKFVHLAMARYRDGALPTDKEVFNDSKNNKKNV